MENTGNFCPHLFRLAGQIQKVQVFSLALSPEMLILNRCQEGSPTSQSNPKLIDMNHLVHFCGNLPVCLCGACSVWLVLLA